MVAGHRRPAEHHRPPEQERNRDDLGDHLDRQRKRRPGRGSEQARRDHRSTGRRDAARRVVPDGAHRPLRRGAPRRVVDAGDRLGPLIVRPRVTRTCVRVTLGLDPARGPRLVLRVGRAARRSSASRPPGDRRRRRGARGELRGQGARGSHGDGRRSGAAAVPGCRGGVAADVGLHGGQQGGVQGVRRHRAGGRGVVDRRGLPRRPRARPHLRIAGRDRGPAAPADPRRGWPPDHRRRRPYQVPGEGRERRRQARRPVAGGARSRARVPASAPGRAAVGRRQGHRRQAPRARDHDRRAGRAAGRAGARADARARVGATPPRARPQLRPPAGGGSAPAPVDRRAASARPSAALARKNWPTHWSRSSIG